MIMKIQRMGSGGGAGAGAGRPKVSLMAKRRIYLSSRFDLCGWLNIYYCHPSAQRHPTTPTSLLLYIYPVFVHNTPWQHHRESRSFTQSSSARRQHSRWNCKWNPPRGGARYIVVWCAIDWDEEKLFVCLFVCWKRPLHKRMSHRVRDSIKCILNVSGIFEEVEVYESRPHELRSTATR